MKKQVVPKDFDMDYVRGCIEIDRDFAVKEIPQLSVPIVQVYYFEKRAEGLVINCKVCHRNEAMDMIMDSNIEGVCI